MGDKSTTGGKVAIIVAIITVIGSLTAAVINRLDFSSKKMEDKLSPSSDRNISSSLGPAGLPAPPPDIEETTNYHPIIENYELVNRINNGDSGCELESGYRIVTMIKEEEDGYSMQDANGYRDTYSLSTNELSRADASWVSKVMLPGRRLKVRCAICGSGGYLELAYVEPLKSFK